MTLHQQYHQKFKRLDNILGSNVLRSFGIKINSVRATFFLFFLHLSVTSNFTGSKCQLAYYKYVSYYKITKVIFHVLQGLKKGL